MKPIKYFFIVIFSLALTGCTNITVETRDLNGDGKPDFWIYRQSNVVVRTEVDLNKDGRADAWYYWKPDGRLIKDVTTFSDGKKFTSFFKNHKLVTIDDVKTWRQEVYYGKAYEDREIQKIMSKQYLYTRDNLPVLSQEDKNQDGIITKTNVLKDFKVIDEYRGPYKGSIKELN